MELLTPPDEPVGLPAQTDIPMELVEGSGTPSEQDMLTVTTVTTRDSRRPKTHAKANTDTHKWTRASAAPLNRTPASK